MADCNDKNFDFDIFSIEDYLDVAIDPEDVKKIVEETPLEKFKPVYVSSYFIVKPHDDLVLKD